MAANASELLSAEFLEKSQFKLIHADESPFGRYKMPYYVHNSVVLLFNTPVDDYNKNNFLIGYAESYGNDYHIVTFRWISKISSLVEIYEAIHQKPFPVHYGKRQDKLVTIQAPVGSLVLTPVQIRTKFREMFYAGIKCYNFKTKQMQEEYFKKQRDYILAEFYK